MKDLILQLLVPEHHALIYETGIYKITNIVTNKIYIGSASRKHKKRPCDNGFYRRFSEHLNNLKKNQHSSIHFQRAWNKSTTKDWKFEIIEVCDSELCFEREQYYLDMLLYAKQFSDSRGQDKRFKKTGYNISTVVKGCFTIKRNTKKVYQYNLDGTFIKEWKSLTDAANFYNDVCSNIGRACKKHITCKGYKWSYDKYQKLIPPDKNPLYLFTPTGEFYKYFSNYDEAIKFFQIEFQIKLNVNVIRKCTNKKVLIYRGFIWNTKDEVTVEDIEANAIVFKNKKFIGVYSSIKQVFNLKIISGCNWNINYTGHYGFIRSKDGYEIFKRCTLEVYEDINKYYELLPNVTKSKRLLKK